ncbi:hypothetical protein [Gemmatimonas sp.]|jgi:hypothetical protein|uniref:hypothetical protein n=1 Tax=Gemmatimonas sp. TaxID=1962908 RepID=UPI0022C8CD04|nr:hypothetical protein [Gemmatimonas sp.]MCA2984127.1 hypothetical protein [Gemmatimonas sp.]MCA2987224.1 hypothetical protein [Gemmatimonas sp.]MCA2991453.1 hypothetical protein [Gemmatimonas sp.]MCA2995438.1 hypothetical protein [Gemmatimonas sp.]MCE2953472.1 hypothetical protein [Gemmatimonas sp.]
MFMSFDRQPQPSRQARYAPSADATGSPFTTRRSPDGARPSTAEPRDYREQADGAP